MSRETETVTVRMWVSVDGDHSELEAEHELEVKPGGIVELTADEIPCTDHPEFLIDVAWPLLRPRKRGDDWVVWDSNVPRPVSDQCLAAISDLDYMVARSSHGMRTICDSGGLYIGVSVDG